MPEAVAALRNRGSSRPEEEVRDALVLLSRKGLIRFWRGVWDREDELVEVSAPDAEALLQDSRWFRFRLDEPAEERLYFVNVENIAT